jgi:hypothetical protein
LISDVEYPEAKDFKKIDLPDGTPDDFETVNKLWDTIY